MDTITELQRIESELKCLHDYLPMIAKAEIDEAYLWRKIQTD